MVLYILIITLKKHIKASLFILKALKGILNYFKRFRVFYVTNRFSYIFSRPEINDKLLLDLYLTTYFLDSNLRKITGLTLGVKKQVYLAI